ncbi:MAG: DUF475 domain-containing protein [Candidatus Omnitrophota bacterium]|jgi:YkoY family integral membrane protein|nr:MAG: DUF475 domain-containing protein [Candidatus Omnitrophota bacterium]
MLHDLFIIVTLVFLEGLLSADNALVLAILVRHLPGKQRYKALKYGIIGAFVFRLIAILLATQLMHFWYFRLIGGGYLLYIAVEHFARNHRRDPDAKAVVARGFWATVGVVELTDIAFSIDSILAAVALSPKIWVIYLGGVLGIVVMRFVAGGFLRLLDKYPRLETTAYLLIAWIGFKLALEAFEIHIPALLFWGVMIALFLQGFFQPEDQFPKKSREEIFARKEAEPQDESVPRH